MNFEHYARNRPREGGSRFVRTGMRKQNASLGGRHGNALIVRQSLADCSSMHVTLEYGTEGLPLDLSGLDVTVVAPTFLKGLDDEAKSFREAMDSPIGCESVTGRIGPDESVAVVIPDITRALPNERLLGCLFAELDQVSPENVVIISGTGTHRENTEEEWIQMVGPEIFRRYRCINHRGGDWDAMTGVGKSPFGYDVHFNREYCEADRRILLGFIEPHFMPGFSGGYKAAFPGVTSVDAIMRYTVRKIFVIPTAGGAC